MDPKRLFLLTTLFLLFHQGASAQPTCFSTYRPLNYCDVAGSLQASEYVFAGRVISISELSNTGVSFRAKAVVAVETPLKGQLNGEVRLTFHTGCAGDLEAGGRYIFNADRLNNAAPAEFSSTHWSNLGGLSPKDVAEAFDGIRSLVNGERLPRIFGRIQDDESRPVPGITVAAAAGRTEYKSRTDAEGHYKFDELPNGDYVVSPVYPKALEPSDDAYGRYREKDERSVRVFNYLPCGQRQDFQASYSGRVGGRVEVEGGDWKREPHFRLFLIPQGPGREQTAYISIIRTGAEQVVGFDFRHVAPGRYLIRLETDVNREAKEEYQFYYPGVRAAEKARVITVAAGDKLEVVIILPTLK
jgi:hypothetical protein